MSALDTFSKCTSRVDPRPRPLPPNFSFSASKTHHSPLKHHPQSLRLVRDQVSLKISTDIRPLVNSVYHGRYFDSKFPCEVRGHSPVTGKARNTKGGGAFVCFCGLLIWLLSSYQPVIIFVLFSPSALVATRFIGRYHGTRQLVTSHTWDSFRQENAFLNINF